MKSPLCSIATQGFGPVDRHRGVLLRAAIKTPCLPDMRKESQLALFTHMHSVTGSLLCRTACLQSARLSPGWRFDTLQ